MSLYVAQYRKWVMDNFVQIKKSQDFASMGAALLMASVLAAFLPVRTSVHACVPMRIDASLPLVRRGTDRLGFRDCAGVHSGTAQTWGHGDVLFAHTSTCVRACASAPIVGVTVRVACVLVRTCLLACVRACVRVCVRAHSLGSGCRTRRPSAKR
jgi:hypothetical protein